jgi:hypothetical protein
MKKPLVKKENLDRLLKLLPHLLKAEGNEWFKTEVKRIVRESEGSSVASQDTLHSYSEVGDHYLIITPNAWLIDYDEIPDEKVRTQLKVDCFEMARNRLGRGNHAHTPDFDEFCRHAHLQIEELVNYYYQKKFGKEIKDIIKSIIYYNAFAKGKIETCSKLGKIPILYKIWALNDKLGLGSESKNIMSQLCYVRNNLSHRSSLTNKEDEKLFDEFERKNGPIRDLILGGLAITDTNIQRILFTKRERWDDVVEVITKLKSKIVQEL